jgi:hypothetical protein
MGKAVAVFRVSIEDGHDYDVRINGRAESVRDLTPLRLLAVLDAAVEQEQDRNTCGCATLAASRLNTELTALRRAEKAHGWDYDRSARIAELVSLPDERARRRRNGPAGM